MSRPGKRSTRFSRPLISPLGGASCSPAPYIGDEEEHAGVAPGGLEALERSLDADELDQAVGAMKWTEIVLSMPRFRFRSSFPLTGPLERVGVSDAFRPGVADFSRISSEPGFAVSEAIHSASIDVTESGTEAAAATASVATVASSTWQPPPKPIVVRVDRPFALLIYDDPTGAVLFAERVVDPRKG